MDVTILTIYIIADRNNLLAVSVESRDNQEDSEEAENVIFVHMTMLMLLSYLF